MTPAMPLNSRASQQRATWTGRAARMLLITAVSGSQLSLHISGSQTSTGARQVTPQVDLQLSYGPVASRMPDVQDTATWQTYLSRTLRCQTSACWLCSAMTHTASTSSAPLGRSHSQADMHDKADACSQAGENPRPGSQACSPAQAASDSRRARDLWSCKARSCPGCMTLVVQAGCEQTRLSPTRP